VYLFIHSSPKARRAARRFGDEVLAAAILDRLLHHSFTLMVQGESYRLKQKRKTGLLGRAEKSN